MPPRKRKQAAREPPADPPATSAAAASDLVPAKMTVAALREELDSRDLDTRGKKAELVARLEAELSGASKGPPPTKKAKKEPAKKAKKEPAKKAKKEPAKKAKKEPAKKAKKEPKEEEPEPAMEIGEDESDFSKAVRALKGGDGSEKKKARRVPKVDTFVPGGALYEVVEDYDCMLNQTNIGHNNNKFYIIQLLSSHHGASHLWTRWGRVGEPGQNAMKYCASMEDGKKEFCKKFKDKTKNSWDDRDNFVPVKGKYTLLEMDDEEGGEEEMVEKLAALDEPDAPSRVVRQCSLDQPTQSLIKLIFDQDMFKDAMKSMEIDTKKMPLGKLSKLQIAKGFEGLEAIEDALSSGAPRSKLAELSSTFYTIIPHSFGRNVPPVIADNEMLQKKFDMLLVLGDIALAQGLERDQEKKQNETAGDVPHPLDVNYQGLKATLTHLKKEEDEFDIIQQYLAATGPTWHNVQILDVFRVDREGEGDRFSAHDALENRRLLWHGTNVAVVAAILKSGLRIMPHSGGRVGKGIYFASECSKSAGYVRSAGTTGIMFLNEVALGKEKHIQMDDWTLCQPPAGYDSIIAKGRSEPDPTRDTTLTFDGKEVVVPQGKPLPQSKFSSSNFSQSEYLVYKESQNRIRYLLKMRMR